MTFRAIPQEDGSDSAAFISAAEAMGWSAVARPGSLRKAARALDYEPKNKPFLKAVDVGAFSFTEVDEILARWPAGQRMVQDLLVGLALCRDPRMSKDAVGGCYGCKTNDVAADFGQVYSVINTPLGFVEGVVISLANWRLYALGISHEEWHTGALASAKATQFMYPLRPQETVGAGAVVHAVYCCAVGLSFHLHQMQEKVPPVGSAYRVNDFKSRVERGLTVMAQLPRGADSERGAFLQELALWADELVKAV